jgi:hypothetical protein
MFWILSMVPTYFVMGVPRRWKQKKQQVSHSKLKIYGRQSSSNTPNKGWTNVHQFKRYFYFMLIMLTYDQIKTFSQRWFSKKNKHFTIFSYFSVFFFFFFIVRSPAEHLASNNLCNQTITKWFIFEWRMWTVKKKIWKN